MPNASDHLPAGAAAKAIHCLHTPGARGRCIVSLDERTGSPSVLYLQLR